MSFSIIATNTNNDKLIQNQQELVNLTSDQKEVKQYCEINNCYKEILDNQNQIKFFQYLCKNLKISQNKYLSIGQARRLSKELSIPYSDVINYITSRCSTQGDCQNEDIINKFLEEKSKIMISGFLLEEKIQYNSISSVYSLIILPIYVFFIMLITRTPNLRDIDKRRLDDLFVQFFIFVIFHIIPLIIEFIINKILENYKESYVYLDKKLSDVVEFDFKNRFKYEYTKYLIFHYLLSIFLFVFTGLLTIQDIIREEYCPLPFLFLFIISVGIIDLLYQHYYKCLVVFLFFILLFFNKMSYYCEQAKV